MDKEHVIQHLVDEGNAREKAHEIYRFYEMQGKLSELESFFVTKESLEAIL